MTRRFGIPRGALLALAVALGILQFGGRAFAISEENDKVLFGPFSVAQTEGARVNIHVIGDPGLIGDPGIMPWTFTIRVFNRRGAAGFERKVDVLPGTFATINLGPLDPSLFPFEAQGRRPMRAEIVGFNPQPDPPGFYTATLEMFSVATGRTQILLGGPDTIPAGR